MASPESVRAAVPATRGPRHHFFGYYGICPWNASGTHLLCLESDFHDRPPAATDKATIGLVDLASGRFEPLAETRAWNLQQGCMLHWLPTDPDRKITYNDRIDNQYGAVVLDVHSGQKRILPHPISALSHDGRTALSLNYARLKSQRPVVGYAGLPDRYTGQAHPAQDGVYRMDAETGETTVVVSYEQAYEFLSRRPGAEAHDLDKRTLWFNHTVFNRDDSRFSFVCRWNERVGTIAHTYLLSADVNGGDLRLLMWRGASHMDWRSPEELLVWARAEEGPYYYLVNDRTGARRIVGRDALTRDGHCSFTRDGAWLLTDTGPDAEDLRTLLLWKMALGSTGKQRTVVLGRYRSPPPYRGEIRCDLHPRWSRDERQVCFDSIHEGTRQVYVMDVGDIVQGAR
jgi:hypothetical protein